jgi:hypothetical protein
LWFGQVSKLGTGGNDFGSNKNGQRGRCYAVNSKRSIDMKTQFVAHVLIRYTILPKPPFTNNDFVGSGDNLLACGLDRFPSWGLGGNDFGCNKDGRRGRCYAVNSKRSIENSICRPRVDQVHHSAETSFYQQMISWALEITYWLVVWASFQAGDWGE